jgi:hypothetical protein
VCAWLAEHLPAAAQQRVEEMLARNRAKQVVASLRTVFTRWNGFKALRATAAIEQQPCSMLHVTVACWPASGLCDW